MRSAPLLVLGWCLLAGCVRIERRSSQQVPPALLGAWHGSWSSSAGGGTGPMHLRLQTFEGRPVVQVDTDHPCLQPGQYRILVEGDRLELWRNQVQVFQATLDFAERKLIGSYGCPEDRGVWGADWSNELPPLGDISGRWRGAVTAVTPGEPHDFTMDLDQSWQQGRLVVTGEVAVDGLLDVFPIDSGEVVWRPLDRFDLLLRGQVLTSRLTLQGLGQLDPAADAEGLILVEDLSGIFVAGTWTAARLPQ